MAGPARPPGPARRHRHRPPHRAPVRGDLSRARHRRRPRRGPGLAPGRHRPAQRRRRTAALAARHPPRPARQHALGSVPDRPIRPRHHPRPTRSATPSQPTSPRPPWCPTGQARPSPDLLGDLAVWRAANTVPDSDHRPTGPKQLAKAHDPVAAQPRAPPRRRPHPRPGRMDAPAAHPRPGHPPGRLHPAAGRATRRGRPRRDRRPHPAPHHPGGAATGRPRRVRAVVADQPPPRPRRRRPSRQRQSAPALTRAGSTTSPTPSARQRATAMQTSAWWPALVTVVDHALARGQTLDALLSIAGTHDPEVDLDDAQALVWRVSLLTDPTPADDTPLPRRRTTTTTSSGSRPPHPTSKAPRPRTSARPTPTTATKSLDDVYTALNAAALGRAGMGVLEPTPAEIEAMVAHAAEWDDAPFTPQRAAHINDIARNYYAERLDTGVGRGLPARPAPHRPDPARRRIRPSRVDPPHRPPANPRRQRRGDARRRPGHPRPHRTTHRPVPRPPRPAHHRRRHRRRVRRPTAPRRRRRAAGRSTSTPPPRRCSTRATCSTGSTSSCSNVAPFPSSSKAPSTPSPSPPPGAGSYVGVAPLGTSLTQTQARLLATLHPSPIVATDADPAGRAAAERAYWLLTQHAVSPRSAALPEGTDPADLLHGCGPDALALALSGGHALAQQLIDNRPRPATERQNLGGRGCSHRR